MRLKPKLAPLFLGLYLLIPFAQAHAQSSSCLVPVDEKQSSPAIDLIENGQSVDRDALMDQIKKGFDSSVLEPQTSDLYSGVPQSFVQYANMPYPGDNDSLNFVKELGSASGLLFTRTTLASNPDIAYQLNFSIDTHPALARNALLRKLGYSIPSPKYYSKIKVFFSSLTQRNALIDDLATLVGDIPSYRFVVGGQAEIAKNNLTMIFQDVVLEPAIIEVPQMHWGIFEQDSTVDTLQSRRSLRALLVPLTLLDIPQSANMYSFEAAKIYNQGINFSRENANLFNNETSIGDVRWISRKISNLTRADWTSIIQAAHYPPDVEALLIEKTIGRVDQFLGILGMKSFKAIAYNEYISIGKVVKGKETQEFYDGYVPRFTYGDPENPLRGTELARYFGVEVISAGLGALLSEANTYLQAITPTKYITEHGQDLTNELMAHIQNNPGQPFIAPVQVWGGPVGGGNLSASRSIITGTYYGSTSGVQLVDTVSASASAGFFMGMSGVSTLGLSLEPQVQYSRNYVHVTPISDMATAWKNKWTNLFVPSFMDTLAKTLTGTPGEDPGAAIDTFLAKMTPGEMFIITDGFTGSATAGVQIPVGAMLGLMTPFTNLSAGGDIGGSYVILNRTTITRTQDGFQVYLSRIHTGAFETQLDVQFYIKLITLANVLSKGKSDTKAFTFPDSFSGDQAKQFQKAIGSLIRKNNSELLEADFEPYNISHQNKGDKLSFDLGPWSWSKRENMQELKITPPVDPTGRYVAKDFTRTVLNGTITKISGADYIDFLSSIVQSFVSWFDLGSNSVGDDPASGFLGTSKTTSISTQLETTPGRPNNTFLKLQQSYSGWTISQKHFLKIIEKMTAQIGNYNPNGGLLDPSEFSQTKKIQAYTILWNMLVYENGIRQAMTLLDIKNTSTLKALQSMVSMIGQDQYQKYCDQEGLKAQVASGPYSIDANQAGTLVESSQGQTTYVGCILPWMQTVYNLRETLSSHPVVFQADVRTESDAKEKIRWVNRAMNRLTRDLKLEEVIGIIGKDNAFFQVNVSGFRTKDERALDENFNANYFSNTIGVINQDVLTGPLSDIENTTEISSNEIEAGYLSDGY